MPQTYHCSPDNRLLQGQPARITLFVGAYGSGKSEVSVNFALWLARTVRRPGQRVVLCDLDTINPYYRSADAREVLEAAGVELIAPMYANTNVDVPAVPPAIITVFDDPDCLAVLDIGGEDLGARVIGSLRDRLGGQDFVLNLVVNPYRPATDTPEGVEATVDALSAAAGLRLNGLIDNANLLSEDNQPELLASLPLIAAACERTGLPLLFAASMSDFDSLSKALDQATGLPSQPPQPIARTLAILPLSRTIHYPTDPFANT